MRSLCGVCCVSLEIFSPLSLLAAFRLEAIGFSVRRSGTEASRERNGHSSADRLTRKHVQKFRTNKPELRLIGTLEKLIGG